MVDEMFRFATYTMMIFKMKILILFYTHKSDGFTWKSKINFAGLELINSSYYVVVHKITTNSANSKAFCEI